MEKEALAWLGEVAITEKIVGDKSKQSFKIKKFLEFLETLND